MKRKSIVVAAALIGLAVSTASASEFRSFDRRAQVIGSELIVAGRVLSTRSDWTANRSAIYTDAKIAVEEVWKGLPDSDRLTVRTVSGTVDGVTLEVEGAARFTEGEHVLVFLGRAYDGSLTPWGMRFGKYAVTGDGDDAFLVGALPPAVSGAQEFVQVSIGFEDLRTEVNAILDREAE